MVSVPEVKKIKIPLIKIINDIEKTESEEKAIKEETQEIKEGLNKDVKENQVNKEIKLKKVSIKKLCGYKIFNQKIIENKFIEK